jgi:hypothetical protein
MMSGDNPTAGVCRCRHTYRVPDNTTPPIGNRSEQTVKATVWFRTVEVSAATQITGGGRKQNQVSAVLCRETT